MLSDILPTGFEIGVIAGQVQPGDTIAIVGAGPIGMAALLTAQFYSPAKIYMIDLDDNRLEMSKKFGATHTINSGNEDVVKRILSETKDGVDVVIEAVGIPATFDICQKIVRPGGHLANIDIHGKPIELQIQNLNTKKTIEHGKRIRECLKQPELQQMPVSEQIVILLSLKNGLLDNIPVEKIKDAQDALLSNFKDFPNEIIKRLSSNEKLSDEDSKAILKIAGTILAPLPDKPKPDENEDKAKPDEKKK